MDKGGGRYSFWLDTVYFSTSDNSDPASNGRTYSIARFEIESEQEATRDRSAPDLASLEPTTPIVGPYVRRGGKGWSITLPEELHGLTDNNEFPERSRLVLLEDEKLLGPGHDRHAAIIQEGGGRYSFWLDTLYFSTSDDSDPASNGRSYSIGRTI